MSHSAHPALHGMVKALRKPFPNVARWMDVTAFVLLMFAVSAFQMVEFAAEHPQDTLPDWLLLVFILLLFLWGSLEIAISTGLFSGILWMRNVPNYFAIGVVKQHEKAIGVYRNIHSGFYRRLEAKKLYSAGTALAGIVWGFWILLDALTSGVPVDGLKAEVIRLLISVPVAHLLVSMYASNRRSKWERMSDEVVQKHAEEKLSTVQQVVGIPIAEFPSLDEIEETLERAELGDPEAAGLAAGMEKSAKSQGRRAIAMIIAIVICTILILLP